MYIEKMIEVDLYTDIFVGMTPDSIGAWTLNNSFAIQEGYKRFKFTVLIPESAFTGKVISKLEASEVEQL